jgi:hypothetical protein
MQEPVGLLPGKGGVFDIFAEYARALLLATSEEVAASVTVGLRRPVVFLVVETVWHRFLLNHSTKKLLAKREHKGKSRNYNARHGWRSAHLNRRALLETNSLSV